MHITHILNDTGETLCGDPQEPRPEGSSTAQCAACYILSTNESVDGK